MEPLKDMKSKWERIMREFFLAIREFDFAAISPVRENATPLSSELANIVQRDSKTETKIQLPLGRNVTFC